MHKFNEHKQYAFPHRPPWWPEEEPWPPRKSPNRKHWHSVRQRFMRRVGCTFIILTIAIIIIAGYLANGMMQHRMPENMHSFMETVPIIVRAISWVLFSAVIVGLIVLGSYFRKAALPMVDMLDAAGKIADGDYSARVPEQGPRDLMALSRAFNNMTDRLQVNDEQRRMLLADISHELRTPLTIIQGNLEGMLDGIYPADPRTLQAVLDETHTLARIIEDLRTLTVVESGSLKLQLETVDPTEFLEEIIPAYIALSDTHQVTLKTSIQPNLAAFELDPTRIREVLANIITNALRYCQPGGEIHFQCQQMHGQKSRLEFIISDNGSGIHAQDLPHIFERFYKGRDSSGSGLGLPIAKSLVEAHGGEIQAESEEGKGTTIRFTIPYSQ